MVLCWRVVFPGHMKDLEMIEAIEHSDIHNSYTYYMNSSMKYVSVIQIFIDCLVIFYGG